jgi:hypothetical protein
MKTERGDAYRHVKQFIHNLWQAEYNTHTLTANHYRTLRPILGLPIPEYPGQRKKQAIAVRLRTGHCLLAHPLFVKKQHPTGLCACGKNETIDHYLFDNTCKLYTQQKNHYLIQLKRLKRPINIYNTLNNSDSLKHTIEYVLQTMKHI